MFFLNKKKTAINKLLTGKKSSDSVFYLLFAFIVIYAQENVVAAS